MIMRKQKQKIQTLHEFLKDFNMFIKYCYLIAGCVEKKRTLKPKRCKNVKGKIKLSSKCALCDSKKSISIKQQETSGFFKNIVSPFAAIDKAVGQVFVS